MNFRRSPIALWLGERFWRWELSDMPKDSARTSAGSEGRSGWSRFREQLLPFIILAGMVVALTVVWDAISFVIFCAQSQAGVSESGGIGGFVSANWREFVDSGEMISGAFFGAENLGNVLRQNAHYGILAVGMTFVILTAGIDLSVGSLLAFSSVVAATMILRFPDNKGALFALMVILAGVSAGALLGLANGVVITYSKSMPGYLWRLARPRGEGGGARPRLSMIQIQPFIVTLAMMSVARGLAFLWTGGRGVDIYGRQPGLFERLGGDITLNVPGWIAIPVALALLLAAIRKRWLSSEDLRLISRMKRPEKLSGPLVSMVVACLVVAGVVYSTDNALVVIPWPGVIFLGVVALAHIILTRTRFGRFTYAIGSNEPAAILSGVPVARVKILVYGLCGGLCGLAGMIYTSVQNTGRPDDGVGFELDAIAAVVIGGTSLMGGKGGVGGTLIGALIIGVLNIVLSLRNIDPNLQRVLKGLIIIIAVLLQRDRDQAS